MIAERKKYIESEFFFLWQERKTFSSSSGLGFILCEKSSPAKKKFQNDGAWENFFYGTDEHIVEQSFSP